MFNAPMSDQVKHTRDGFAVGGDGWQFANTFFPGNNPADRLLM